ncbi:MAG: hypothetical protein ACFFG0_45950 [Candidatus Thorarchaeota archaeon]
MVSGHDYKLKGYPSNSMGYNYFYLCSYESIIIPDYSIQVSHPSDVSYIERSTGDTITWYLTAQNVSNPTYSIYRNMVLIINDAWVSGGHITINIDGLSVDTYLYSISAQNSYETAIDSFLMTVTAEENGDEDRGSGISSFPVVFLIIVSMILIFYIQRKIQKQTRYTRKI